MPIIRKLNRLRIAIADLLKTIQSVFAEDIIELTFNANSELSHLKCCQSKVSWRLFPNNLTKDVDGLACAVNYTLSCGL